MKKPYVWEETQSLWSLYTSDWNIMQKIDGFLISKKIPMDFMLSWK